MGSETFQKRERERKRQERAAERRERREARKNDETEPVSTEDLMEQFRILSEQHAAGAIDAETYEAQRSEIFVQLGLADPLES
jgi:hypothetical protein